MSCVRLISVYLASDVADVVVSLMFGPVHSGLVQEAMPGECGSEECGSKDVVVKGRESG